MKIEQRITFLRKEMLIHSYLYYKMDQCVISDWLFDRMALELKHLQESYPDLAATLPFSDLFENWDGTTGFHLAGHISDDLKKSAEELLHAELY